LASSMEKTHSTIDYLQVTKEHIVTSQTSIATESSITLSVNGKPLIVFQCTPTELKALAIGFLYNEGYIKSFSEVSTIQLCQQENQIDVWLDHKIRDSKVNIRQTDCFNSSSSMKKPANPLPHFMDKFSINSDDVFNLVDQFLSNPKNVSKPVGVHRMALSDGSQILLMLDDIGRHNLLDKIAGLILVNDLNIKAPALITTGRLSSEIVHKTSRMKIPFLISLHSASQLAVSLSDQLGITIISHAGRSKFNLLCHPERIHFKTNL
jgi:FdhD protein